LLRKLVIVAARVDPRRGGGSPGTLEELSCKRQTAEDENNQDRARYVEHVHPHEVEDGGGNERAEIEEEGKEWHPDGGDCQCVTRQNQNWSEETKEEGIMDAVKSGSVVYETSAECMLQMRQQWVDVNRVDQLLLHSWVSQKWMQINCTEQGFLHLWVLSESTNVQSRKQLLLYFRVPHECTHINRGCYLRDDIRVSKDFEDRGLEERDLHLLAPLWNTQCGQVALLHTYTQQR
jgi:hypothetical protein